MPHDESFTLTLPATAHCPAVELRAVLWTRHPDGAPERLFTPEPCVLPMDIGEFVPLQHGDEDSRRPTMPSLKLDPQGRLVGVALQEAQTVQTPLGPLRAELLHFHPDGALKRLFPLDGKLSAYWTWQDEMRLAEPLAIPLPAPAQPKHRPQDAPEAVRLINIAFWPDGAMRSLTLWPGETLTVQTPQGPVLARVGVSFHPNGSVATLEPAKQAAVETPIGPLRAFDPDPEGVSGDVNSLAFDEAGAVRRLSTVLDAIRVTRSTGEVERFTPQAAPNLCAPDDCDPATEQDDVPEPLTLCFEADHVTIHHGRVGPSGKLPPVAGRFPVRDPDLTVQPDTAPTGLTLLGPVDRSCG